MAIHVQKKRLLAEVAVVDDFVTAFAAVLVTADYGREFLVRACASATSGVVGAAAVVRASGVVRASRIVGAVVRGVGRGGSAVLYEGDLVGQEVVDALLVDKLEGGVEGGDKTLDELGGCLCLGLHGAGGDEADGEVAEAEELDVVALLEVLLDVVGVAVEDVLDVSRGGTGLGCDLVCHVVGGQQSVAEWLNTVHGLGVILVEHHRVFDYFVRFRHRELPIAGMGLGIYRASCPARHELNNN